MYRLKNDLEKPKERRALLGRRLEERVVLSIPTQNSETGSRAKSVTVAAWPRGWIPGNVGREHQDRARQESSLKWCRGGQLQLQG